MALARAAVAVNTCLRACVERNAYPWPLDLRAVGKGCRRNTKEHEEARRGKYLTRKSYKFP